LAQRNEVRSQWDQIQPELQQHRQLQGYLSQHNLASDDVNALLAVGAALRAGDHKSFLDGVAPYVMAAQEALGLRIARDLQTQVDDGTVSEEAAREMTRTRHRAMQAEQRLQEQTTIATTEATNRNVMAIRHGVEQWESNIRTRDPDYPHKANAVRRFSQALLQERGTPQTTDQAVALVQAAYDEANAELRRLRPQPQATRPAPSGIHSAGNGAMPPTAEPRSMMDAARLALAAMRQAR
jgi:pyruvate-formate lyase